MPSPAASASVSHSNTDPSACAMAFRVKDAAKAFKRAVDLGATPVSNPVGPMELQHSGDRRHRRQHRLSRGSLRRSHDLRRRFRAGTADGRAPQHGPAGDRSPDAQRATRQHEQVGRLLRAAVQLPRNPLFRHRRQEDGPVQQGHDESVRQDPHPDQRVAGRQVADRGIPARIPGRGHPAHRAVDRGHLRARSMRCVTTASSSRTHRTPTTKA